jgi:hypothetical protein
LWDGFNPGGFPKGTFVIFRGYIDESFNRKLFTLSCLMSDPSGWMWFESAWKKVLRNKNKSLKSQGRRLISRYHAADCSSLKGEFEGWTVAEQIEFTKSLLLACKKSKFFDATSYSMPLDDFVEEFPEFKQDPIGYCYVCLLDFLMIEMVRRITESKAKQGSTKEVHILLFHDRCAYDAALLQAFNRRMKDETFVGKEMFSTIAPLSSMECIPLQAADLVAYENFKDSEGNLVGRKRRKTLELLLSSNSYGGTARTFKPNAIRALRFALDLPGLISSALADC